MKLGMYLKESWYNLRKDRVYSAVYIIGTGFSLALVMAWLTVQSMHFDNSYPEVNRDRMLVIPTFTESQKGSQGGSNAMVSQVFVDRFIRNEPVEGLETLTTVAFRDAVVANDLGEAVGSVASDVDMEYWKVFGFDFLYGHALSETSYNQAAPEAVICESLARTLYGREDIVGDRLFIDAKEYRVCGVVRDVPQTASLAFSQLWLPDLEGDSRSSLEQWIGRPTMMGEYFVYLLARDRSDFGTIRKTLEDRLKRYNNGSDVEYELSFQSGIPSVREMALRWTGMTSASFTWIGIGIMFFILLIPMINLSGMVGSRMEARMSEFGVRKSFGAWRGDVLQQITGENLLLTLLGGVLGLVLSYVLLGVFSEQFNGMVPGEAMAMAFSMEKVEAAVFSVRDFFKLKLYVLLLAIVLVLNIVSALIPAFKVIRRPITDSLNSVK